MSHFIDTIERDDLPPDLQLVANVVGIETMRRMIEHLHGDTFYIVSKQRLGSAVRRYIQQQQKEGRAAREIARELGVSVGFVRRVMRKE